MAGKAANDASLNTPEGQKEFIHCELAGNGLGRRGSSGIVKIDRFFVPEPIAYLDQNDVYPKFEGKC
jgi:hypothetical protein